MGKEELKFILEQKEKTAINSPKRLFFILKIILHSIIVHLKL